MRAARSFAMASTMNVAATHSDYLVPTSLARAKIPSGFDFSPSSIVQPIRHNANVRHTKYTDNTRRAPVKRIKYTDVRKTKHRAYNWGGGEGVGEMGRRDSDAECSHVTALSSRKSSTVPYVTRASLRTRDHDGGGKTEEARLRGDGSSSVVVSS